MDQLRSLASYCHCKEEEEPSHFCLSVFSSFYSSGAIKRSKQSSAASQGASRAMSLAEGGAPLVGLVSAVTRRLVVHYLVVVVAGEAGMPEASRLAKAALGEGVQVTVVVV